MKITQVTPINLADQVVLVRIQTDAGVQGIGEASPMVPSVICQIIQDVLSPLLIGEDPGNIEGLLERTFYTRPGRFIPYKLGPQGALTSAVSGVEIALWDILGKSLDVPLYRLLGGLYRSKIPVFASLGLSGEKSPQGWAQAAGEFVGLGYGGVKVSVGQEWGFDRGGDEALATVRATRQAIGEGIDLLVDAHSAFYPHSAAKVARQLEEYNVCHFEEPIAAYDWENLAWIRQQTTTPIAAGEQVYLLAEFARFLQLKAVDILQFDLIKVGGFNIAKKIAALAESCDLPLVLHNYHSPVATTAALHFIASTPVCRYRQEVRASPHPLARIVRNPPILTDGCLSPPDSPGLGLELDDEEIDRFAIKD